MKIKSRAVLTIVCLIMLLGASTTWAELYFPDTDDAWARVTPQELGWDSRALDEVLAFLEERHS